MPATTTNVTCIGCFDGQDSEFASGLSGHYVQFGRDSNVFLVWIILKLFGAVLLYWKVDSEIELWFPLL